MAQINVVDLTFCYEGSFENVFEHVSFSIDTNWKLGLIGRNGKGKTTFLNLLLGKYSYRGTIHANTFCDYFPYVISDEMSKQCAVDFLSQLKSGCEDWKVICELVKLDIDPEVLYRPFNTLSYGERTKVMLAILFSGENDFLLIDEPTNHLDQHARDVVKQYLMTKRSFILVSHDRDLLDACVDNILVLNRKSIEVQAGNFSSWWENKQKKDQFAKAENEKQLREISSLKKAADRSERWAVKSENRKIGFDPVKEHDRTTGTRSYIGSKTKKMQARVKNYEKRIERKISAKEGLLQDIENYVDLKIFPMKYHKERVIYIRDLDLSYSMTGESVFSHPITLEINCGERIFLHGTNGCGKSTLIKKILSMSGMEDEHIYVLNGELQVSSGLKISYINQDTSFLHGTLTEFCKEQHLDESLFYALLRQLDLERTQLSLPMEDFSEGQKKKILIAASLMTPAHLYIWDEPLNYIDVFSRMQIEKLLLMYQPTMLIVDHDVRFRDKIATRIVNL